MTKPECGGDPPENREDDSALVDAREAARLCRISPPMLYKLNADGKMPPPIRLGKLMRWRRKEIVEWIEKGCPDVNFDERTTK